MPDVNDDMDELFKKAGENYPLNTNSGDWNEVQKALEPSNFSVSNVPEKKKSRRFLWLLLLLIPFSVEIGIYVFSPAHQSAQIAGKQVKPAIASPLQKKFTVQDMDEQKMNHQVITGSRANTNITTVTAKDTKTFTTPSQGNINTTLLKIPGSVLKDQTLKPAISLPNIINPVNNDITANAVINKPGINNQNTISSTNKTPAGKDISDVSPLAANNNPWGNNPGINKADAIDHNAGILKENNKIIPSQNDTSKKTIAKRTDKDKIHQQRFYVGLAGGPDVSTIELQKVTRTGFNLAIIAGYKFSKRWSIETGVSLDKKYYYTEGKYFSTKNTPIPAYEHIISLDGNCNMIELPLNIKYDFITGKKTNWFALAGSSSYLMKKEDYGYQWLGYNGLMENMVSYKNSSKNWASIINLSIGYSRVVGRSGTLRIEPYIKIPVNGVGYWQFANNKYGDLPGLH